ncbi:hypothetical protein DL95DRAFT_391140, partial [Leptodontidium sp. 2 PMI_412]
MRASTSIGFERNQAIYLVSFACSRSAEPSLRHAVFALASRGISGSFLTSSSSKESELAILSAT